MKERISQLKNHYIVCGAGIIGLVVIEELTLARKKIVLIDSDEDKLKKASKKFKCFTLIGDATKEETLKRANINRASGLIACFSDDHESVYMTMTARQLNKNLKIITKVKHEESLKKLQIAGADDVINPDHIGGMRIASHILRPRVVKFIDMLARDPKNVRIEEVEINEKSPFINKKLTIETIESKLKSRIIALKKNQGSKYLYKLSGKMLTLKKGDILYILKARS